MAPNSLLVTKLAVQISADDESAHTLLCLKISIPRELESKNPGRWALFGSNIPPTILPGSEPQIHSLPLSSTSNDHAAHIRTAALLLSLTPDSARSTEVIRSAKPAIEVNLSTGQIYISLDQHLARKRRETMQVGTLSPGGSMGGATRKEYLVVLELEGIVDSASRWFKLHVPLPKCLDNLLRLQISPPRSSSSTSTGEVSIVTEPKILPVPASTFSSPAKTSRSISASREKTVQEEGWEDGESLGPEDLESDSSDDEGGASWLEGRFQSTDAMHLEWSFASTTPSSPCLHVTPRWDKRNPSIDVEYDASITALSPHGVEAELPEGWGWSELRIEGEGLVSWSCIDGEVWDHQLSSAAPVKLDLDSSNITDRPDEDSFSTIRARKYLPSSSRILPSLSRSSSGSGASLMRQHLPQPDSGFDEFSFELNNVPTPLTSTNLHSPICKIGPPSVILPRPVPGRIFDLIFADGIEETRSKITGKLVPLSKTMLVSPSVPVISPIFRLADADNQCQYSDPSEQTFLIDIDHPPRLKWLDHRQQPMQPSSPQAIKGDIDISLSRPRNLKVNMTITFPWPKRATEVSIQIPQTASMEEGGQATMILRARMRGRALPQALVQKDLGWEVRLGKGEGWAEGLCTVILELDDDDFEEMGGLPVFEGAIGRMTVKLVGRKWESADISTNLSNVSPLTFSTSLPPPSPIRFQIQKQFTTPPSSTSAHPSGRVRALWSWSTLINVFMLYLLLSLGQQCQRMRSEISFVSDENKDLRTYTTKMQEEIGRLGIYGYDKDDRGIGLRHSWSALEHQAATGSWGQVDAEQGGSGRSLGTTNDRDHGATSIGRVVLGPTGWNLERWLAHPTVFILTKSLAWLWHTAIWLVHV